MSAKQRELTIGLEEELFLVDKKTTELCSKWPDELGQACSKSFPNQIIPEFLSGQVELVSSPFFSIPALHKEMIGLRQCLIKETQKHGLAPMASGTHPSAKWRNQIPTPSDRYQRLAEELKITGERMLVCGTHIHIGITDINRRLRLFNELTYFLPIILSLTSSSPFWSGLDSGLMSYRSTIINGLPRAGLPPVFACAEDYHSYLLHMTESGAIKSGKELWWDLRLSANFPTVELRIGDTCTQLDDLMGIAALVQSLSRYLLLNEPLTKSELDLRHLCTKENRWRAQRYSLKNCSFLMVEENSLNPMNNFIKAITTLLRPHAKALGCEQYLMHCLTICERGTSADNQKQVFKNALNEGKSSKEAIDEASRYLIEETLKVKAGAWV